FSCTGVLSSPPRTKNRMNVARIRFCSLALPGREGPMLAGSPFAHALRSLTSAGSSCLPPPAKSANERPFGRFLADTAGNCLGPRKPADEQRLRRFLTEVNE